MNWVEIQDGWEHFRPLIGSYWKELSIQEVEECKGDRTILAVILQKQLGIGPEEAEQQICRFEKEIRLPGAAK